MRSPRYRALYFLPPGGGLVSGTQGLEVDAGGHLRTVRDGGSLRQAILLLLATKPGERVMRPAYGCELHRIVFEPNDATTAGLAIHYVRQALERWEPRAELLRVDANPHPDDYSRMVIDVEYRVRATQELEQMTFTLALAEDQG